MSDGTGGFDRRKFIEGGAGLLAAANTALSQQSASALTLRIGANTRAVSK